MRLQTAILPSDVGSDLCSEVEVTEASVASASAVPVSGLFASVLVVDFSALDLGGGGSAASGTSNRSVVYSCAGS